jgi:hypothetical protein
MKTCSNCGHSKPLSEFHATQRRGKPYVYAQCKECHRRYARAHYVTNKPAYLARAQVQRQTTEGPLREFIAGYLREHPCVDCGESDIVVLHFDHCRGVKVRNISSMVKRRYSLSTIEAEIAKCDVRCANCHARRTAQQFGWWSLAL